MSRQTALQVALPIALLALFGAAVLAASEPPAAGSASPGGFAPSENVRADDSVPFPVNI